LQTFLIWLFIIIGVFFYFKVPLFRQLINTIFLLIIKTLLVILKLPLLILGLIERKLGRQNQQPQPKVGQEIPPKVNEPTPKIVQQKQSKELPDCEKLSQAEQYKWISEHPELVSVYKPSTTSN
jgi:hypothetical protein